MTKPFDRDLWMRAWRFAAERHHGQVFTGTELPYLVHLGAVAMEVAGTLAVEAFADPDRAIACAILHDVVEDSPVTRAELAAAFGEAVADGVQALTKDPAVPKPERMDDSVRRILAQGPEIALVKLADRTVNMQPAPPTWSRAKREGYRDEARRLLEALGGASPTQAARLAAKIAAYPLEP